MKKYLLLPLFIISIFATAQKANAQFYEIANGLQSVLGPALSGAGNYSGSVDAGYSRSLGQYQADFIELSTTQGYKFNSWFYWGAGLGLDYLISHHDNDWGNWNPSFMTGRPSTSKAFMLPLYSDFKFSIGGNGGSTKASFFVDLRVGCSFLLSNKYIEIGKGYLTNNEYFYLRPTIGVRIPVKKEQPKYALNIGVSYRLLASNYWYNINNNITLQCLGANIGFEW